jgi:hypothetical protein
MAYDTQNYLGSGLVYLRNFKNKIKQRFLEEWRILGCYAVWRL